MGDSIFPDTCTAKRDLRSAIAFYELLPKDHYCISTVITIAVFAFVFWLYSGAWNKPLGPTLRIPTATEFSMPPTWTPVSQSEAALVSTPGTVARAVPAISSATSVAPTEAPATTAPAVTAYVVLLL